MSRISRAAAAILVALAAAGTSVAVAPAASGAPCGLRQVDNGAATDAYFRNCAADPVQFSVWAVHRGNPPSASFVRNQCVPAGADVLIGRGTANLTYGGGESGSC